MTAASEGAAVSQSPIAPFLDAVDRLYVDAAIALMAPGARVLVADGRRAEGTEAVRQLFGDFRGQLRSTTHRITAQMAPGGRLDRGGRRQL
jgi:ketosteroid isomerase-like protein